MFGEEISQYDIVWKATIGNGSCLQIFQDRAVAVIHFQSGNHVQVLRKSVQLALLHGPGAGQDAHCFSFIELRGQDGIPDGGKFTNRGLHFPISEEGLPVRLTQSVLDKEAEIVSERVPD